MTLLYRYEIDTLSPLATLTDEQRNTLDNIDTELFVPLKDKRGELVGVFPEATMSRSFEIKEIKNGAVRMARALAG